MKVALYARVSTKQHGQDVETQLHALKAWAKQKSAASVTIYADKGWSGAKNSRPELDRLMRDARRGQFDAVIVARFDRFGRSVQHLLASLEEFKKLKIRFVSLNEAIDTDTPIGRFFFTIVAAFAEFERAVISERVRMGLERAKSEGKIIGRPRKAQVDEAAICHERHKKSLSQLSREWGLARSTIRGIWKRKEEAKAVSQAAQGPGRRAGGRVATASRA